MRLRRPGPGERNRHPLLLLMRCGIPHLTKLPPLQVTENQVQMHSQLGQVDVYGSESSSMNGATTAEKRIYHLNSQVKLLMSNDQAPSQTTQRDQDLSCRILGWTNIQNGVRLSGQSRKDLSISNIDIPKTWILLDSQSNVNLFCNKYLMDNIRVGDVTMSMYCSAGKSHSNLVIDAPLFHQDIVRFHFSGITNVLFLDQAIQHYPDTYNIHNINVFLL